MKIKPSICMHLELFILLVYFNIKDSYLVDCCALEPMEANILVESICQKYFLTRYILVVIEIGSDIVVAHRETLISKCTDNMHNSSIVVLVENNELFLMQALEKTNILNYLCTRCANLLLDPVSDVISLHEVGNGILSMPLIAGWLLRYPCIYHSVPSASVSGSSGGISMLELIKVSYTGRVTITDPMASSSMGMKPSRKQKHPTLESLPIKAMKVELLGFSIPSFFLDENLDLKTVFESATESIFAKLLQEVVILPSWIQLTNIEKHESRCIVPSIVL